MNINARHLVIGFGPLVLCLLTASSSMLWAQNSDFSTNTILPSAHNLSIVFEIDSTRQVYNKQLAKVKFADKLSSAGEVAYQLDSVLQQLNTLGYLAADVKSLEVSGDSSYATVGTGPVTEWVYLRRGNVDPQLLRAVNYKKKDWQSSPFHYLDLLKLQDAILRKAAENGFPFATIGLDSLVLEPGRIAASLSLHKHRLILYDSIYLLGNAKIARAYLETYLGISGGQPYNETAIRKISTRIEELPFLRETKPPELRFYGERAAVGLFLEPINANKFDLLLGVLPNSEITGRLTITGEGRLHLQNALGSGEKIKLDYRQLIVGTRELKAGVAYPYLPLLPFGANLDFELYIRDTTFLDRTFDGGLQYTFQGNNFLRGFGSNKRTVLLEVDTAVVRSSQRLPEVLDIAVNRYGLEYQHEELDYRYNPRKGFSLNVKGSAGTRRVLPNSLITSLQSEDFDAEALYDSVGERQNTYQLEAALDFFVPVAKRQVIHWALNGAILTGPVLYENERYRLGGNQLLRGFDEESIFATRFALLSMEYRLQFGRNSFGYLFWDGAYLEDNSLEGLKVDRPFGFGIGMNFETRAGIFGLSYALGRQQGNPIEFRSAKLHFGYVNYF